MSMWTHITACLSVETGIEAERSDVKKEVKKCLKDAPKITGSERNADVFVNVLSGYNHWMNRDCSRCRYKDTLKYVKKDGFQCDAPNDFKCPDGKYQSQVIISIQGDLRDRTKDETRMEFYDFFEYVRNHYNIRDYSLNIEI